MKFIEVDKKNEHLYDSYVSDCSNCTFYHTIKFRNVLEKTLPYAESHYFLATDNSGKPIGALPMFMASGAFGKILNSLPFLGSYGGILQKKFSLNTFKFLLKSIDDFAKNENVSAMTIIGSPFSPDASFYARHMRYDYIDKRISMVSQLPQLSEDFEDKLLALYKGTLRTNIRKSNRSGISFTTSYDINSTLSFLYKVHNETMATIGGIQKQKKFYQAVMRTLQRGDDYQVYEANFGGERVAALLIFFQKDTAEYYLPAVLPEHRNKQPLPGLIHYAIKDSVAHHNVKRWNWGGTGVAMNGVYKFKKKWGPLEGCYYYYNRIFASSKTRLLKANPTELGQEYPYFYVLPFNQLMA